MRFNAFPVQKRIMWPLICLIDPHHRPTNHTKRTQTTHSSQSKNEAYCALKTQSTRFI